MKKVIIFIIIAVQVSFSILLIKPAQAGIIPDDRIINWQGNVGVSGDIPNRTTICATLSPSGEDDTVALQTAIDNCPGQQVVKLSAGTFNISSPIKMGYYGYGVVLRGAGMGVTLIKGMPNFPSGSSLVDAEPRNQYGGHFVWDLSWPPPLNLTSNGLNKGSITIQTSTAHGYTFADVALGLYVQVDQLYNASANPPINPVGSGGACGASCGRGCDGGSETNCRPFGQIVKVIGIPSTTALTLEIPLYYNYDINKYPQVALVGIGPDGGNVNGSVIEGMGIEDLTLDNTLSQKGDIVFLAHAVNSWLLRVELVSQNRSYISMWRTYRNTVRSCKMHGMNASNQPGVGYTILVSPGGSANLFEDNIIYDAFAAFIANGTTSGNVFAYNYVDFPQTGFMVPGTVYLHGAHNLMNLFEGNWLGAKVVSDWVWGTSSHQTFYRNKIMNLPVVGEYGSNNNFVVELMHGQQYFNFAGNILGTIGRETAYEMDFDDQNWDLTRTTIYTLGHASTGVAAPGDPFVISTLYRHGNWDSIHNAVVWNEANPDHALPVSLYLLAKPDWWGNEPWPPIGPDVSGYYNNIPAKDRYDGFSPDTSPPTAPTGLRVN